LQIFSLSVLIMFFCVNLTKHLLDFIVLLEFHVLSICSLILEAEFHCLSVILCICFHKGWSFISLHISCT